jgi:WD40 repeat protein
MSFKALRPLNADDVFISYTRLDASTYATGLADKLTQLGFSCFIDRLGTDPDEDLPDTLRRKIRNCSMLVVVGTERAAGREIIEKEIREFLASGRTSIVPVSFGDAVYSARWYSLVQGIAPEPELRPSALNDGDPSDSVVSRIEKQFNYQRRDERLQRLTSRAIAVLVLLVVAIAGAAGVAWQQLARAAAATASANAETLRAADAAHKAQVALDAARVAKNEADAARVDANKQRDEATKQKGIADRATQNAAEKTRLASQAARNAQEATARATAEQARAQTQKAIADSRSLANRSQTVLRQRPEEFPGSVLLAIEALKKYPTVEADSALRGSIALLPRLQTSARSVDYADVAALSTDGSYFATLTAGHILRIYEAAFAKPLTEVACHGEMLALSNNAAYTVVADRNDAVIFDLKNGGQHSFKIGKQAHYIEQIAMSPGGKYLAVLYGSGVPPESVTCLYEAANGRLVQTFADNLGIIFKTVSFGPSGDLALSGFEDKRSDAAPSLFSERHLIWPLSNKLTGGETGRELTDEDFAHPFEPRIESDSDNIAPGPNATTIATETAVWRYEVSNQFECVARIPVTYALTEEERTSQIIKHLALNGEGTRLTILTKLRYRPDFDGEPRVPRPADTSVPLVTWQLEVWDTTGQSDAAHVRDFSSFPGLVFGPNGRLAGVASNPGPPATVKLIEDAEENPADGAESTEGQSTVLVSRGLDFVITDDPKTAYVRGIWKPKKIAVPYGEDLQGLNLTAAITHDGRFLALVGPDAKTEGTTVVVYRMQGDKYVKWKRLTAKDETLRLELSHDARLLAMINSDHTAQLWDLADDRDVTYPSLKKLKGVESLVFGPDGSVLAATDKSADSAPLFTHILRVADGVEIASIPHGSAVTEPVFSPNGHQLLDAGPDGIARLVDLSTGREKHVLQGLDIYTAAFSRDERYVAAVTFRSQLLVYKTEDLENEVARLELNSNPVNVVAFSEDDHYVATGAMYYVGNMGMPLRVWALQPETLIENALERLALLPKPATRPHPAH